MRLWHYKLIPYLPNSQLLAQWRELNSIFKKQDKHILINYIYEYPKNDLAVYTCMVISEMEKRKFKINNLQNAISYFNWNDEFIYKCIPNLKNANIKIIPFKNHHNDRYLLQCYFNLQEKYDRGQKDFSEDEYWKLYEIAEKINNRVWICDLEQEWLDNGKD